MFAIADLMLKSFVIDTSVVTTEIVKKVFEDVFIVSICSLHHCGSTQVLVGKVDPLTVHPRQYFIMKFYRRAQKNNSFFQHKTIVSIV